jgi:3D (Asp-Asp-Asp) domain-containing protein
MRVTVTRREWQTRIESRPIAATSEVVNDRALFKGQETVRSAGQPGTEDRRVAVLYADGRAVLAMRGPWSIVTPPVPRVVAIGTRATIASRGDFAGREFMVFVATAYYPGPDNFGGGVGPRTAIGLLAERGVVAVDPSVIPLGTHLYIEGYGYAVAGDTGGDIQGHRIDLCYNTYQEAMHFGRRQVRVFILDQH